ncbi:MAG: FecR family protein [Nitrospirota bacterium]
MTRPTVSAQIITVCLILLFTMVIVPEHCYSSTAPSPIGTVKEIRSGTLERQSNNVWKPLVVGTAISANDRVRTGADGTAVLALNEIGAVLIGPGTEYYLGDPASGFKTLLKRGYLWISAKLSPGRTMSVATSNAVAGVRGTKFSVIQDAQGMDVCTCKGAVEVSLRDGTSKNVTGGMYAAVNTAGKMEKPEKGKPHLEEIWKKKPARYAACLNCHKKGKKIGDLN